MIKSQRPPKNMKRILTSSTFRKKHNSRSYQMPKKKKHDAKYVI